jgi:hypothetical protein
MTSKHGFLETLKNMAFEEEPEKPEKAASSASVAARTEPASAHVSSVHAAPGAATVTAPVEIGTVADSDEVYQRLLARTDFQATEVAATIHTYLDPLQAIADTVMPPNIKFRTAVLQAKAHAGLSEEGILNAFDKLKAQLDQEQEAFTAKAQQFAAHEVSGRQEKISQISTQIAELQQQLAQLSGELAEAQGKSSHAQSQFAAALQRRAIEIEQQKEQYAALLKG